MSIVNQILNSEPGLSLVATVLGSLWTFFKSRDLFSERRASRRVMALEALEAGVDETYRTYVREIKKAREDGKLTYDEIRRARKLARDAAVKFGKTRGVNVAKAVGKEYIDLWIEKFVNRAKRK